MQAVTADCSRAIRLFELGSKIPLISQASAVVEASDETRRSVTPRVSVVVAVYNEAENLGAVCAELQTALRALEPVEVILVDDGSTDATAPLVAAMRAENPGLRLLRHDRRCGKTAALRTGAAAARADWIATMDGDGQNDPADIVAMIEAAWQSTGPAPLVAGVRARRHDPWSRRVATRFANRLRRAVLADNCPDTGCGLKAFRRDDFMRLPMFEGMHRFLPALFQAYGHGLICHPVAHRPRLAGRSKYSNLGRALVGIGDLFGVIWLRSRTRLPAEVTEN